MVVALIALFVALGGGATAGVLITGKQIKNGTLRAVDFKDGELPEGPPGPQGPAGPTGPRGPSDGYVFSKDGDSITTPTSKVIGSLTLPPGKYIVNAKALLGWSATAGFIDCILRTNGTVLDQAQFYLPTGGGGAAPSDEMAVLLAGVDLPAGGTLEFLCQRANAQVSGVSADDIRMTAIQVDSLTATSG